MRDNIVWTLVGVLVVISLVVWLVLHLSAHG